MRTAKRWRQLLVLRAAAGGDKLPATDPGWNTLALVCNNRNYANELELRYAIMQRLAAEGASEREALASAAAAEAVEHGLEVRPTLASARRELQLMREERALAHPRRVRAAARARMARWAKPAKGGSEALGRAVAAAEALGVSQAARRSARASERKFVAPGTMLMGRGTC